MPVANVKTYTLEQDCKLPADCSDDIITDGVLVQLTPDEEIALFRSGVWLQDDPSRNWAKQASDGAVWAGNLLSRGHSIAKVRARDGRRMGGGNKPKPIKRLSTSFTLLPEEKKRLEALAKKASKATGVNVSASMIVSELLAVADDIMPTVLSNIRSRK